VGKERRWEGGKVRRWEGEKVGVLHSYANLGGDLSDFEGTLSKFDLEYPRPLH